MDGTAVLARTEAKCSRCGTSLIRIKASILDKIICPSHLTFDDYREGISGAIELRRGPIVDEVLIGVINRFWLTGRQPS
jgi:hypothetical protein